MNEITVSTSLIAACGLYCGACRKHLSGKCPGCRKNDKATWCKIRTCVSSHAYDTCAECPTPVTACSKCNNLISRLFALIFKSDRPACIQYIREHGPQAFAQEMSHRKCQTIKRR